MKQNKVQPIGYVGGSPKSFIFKDGIKKVEISVATHYKKRSDKVPAEYATDWHKVIAWAGRADYAEATFVKGSHILVEGSIQYREYTNSAGLIKKLTEVRAESLINLDR